MISEQLAGFLQLCAQSSEPLGHSDQETSGLLQVAEQAAPLPGAAGDLLPSSAEPLHSALIAGTGFV